MGKKGSIYYGYEMIRNILGNNRKVIRKEYIRIKVDGI